MLAVPLVFQGGVQEGIQLSLVELLNAVLMEDPSILAKLSSLAEHSGASVVDYSSAVALLGCGKQGMVSTGCVLGLLQLRD